MNTTDSNLQERVLTELRWEPSVDAAEIGVTADDHVITLQGHVKSYSEKVAAERAARRMLGVKAIANEIHVAPGGTHGRSDSDIASAAVSALGWSMSVPQNAVKLTVTNGFLTLHGEVEWGYQRRACERAVRDLHGVIGVSNEIVVKPHATAADIEVRIASAFERSAALDARHIRVAANHGRVELQGTVHSHAERDEAGYAAWAAPGVSAVENRLIVTA